MESSFNFGTHLHNGDPLTARTTHVPAGRPSTGNPPFSWEESAVDALGYDGASSIKEWDLATILYFLEGYNGWGYRTGAGQATTPPKRSAYLWSMTNQYEKGKYVADGKFDPNAVSTQAGVCAILKECENRGLIQLTQRQEPETNDPKEVTWFNAFLLVSDHKFELGLAAKLKASDDTFATSRIPVDQKFVDAFLNQFPNARSVLVAESDKPWPGDFSNPSPAPDRFTKEKLITIAEAEAKLDISWRGNGKAKKYTKKFEPVFGTGRFSWCAAFVTWCCEQAGIKVPTKTPGDPNGYTFALCEAWQQWAIRNGYWRSRTEEPQRGWIVLFDWDGAQDPDYDWEDHIGIYTGRRDGSLFVCAEGNVNDATAMKSRNFVNIQGYICLPDGLVSI